MYSQSPPKTPRRLPVRRRQQPCISKLEFIPLVDGTYTSLSEGVVWLGIDKTAFRGFENVYSKLRIVSPDLFNTSSSENVTEMLIKLGVRRFSLDDVLELVILPCICDEKVALGCGCVWTSDGCKRLGEVDIHFGKGYGNLIDMGKLLSGSDMKWYEVDVGYLDHPVVKALPDGEMKLRKFLEKLGIVKKDTDRRENVRKCKTLDYDSQELKRLLSHVSLNGNREKGRDLLEVIDSLWVEYFSDKSTSFGYV
nr:hypothetical protein [Tanacetum cinerariifolium]